VSIFERIKKEGLKTFFKIKKEGVVKTTPSS
jgi:hypothetical protein